MGGKIASALEPFQDKVSSLVLLTVNGELKFIQNRSKAAFEAKGRLNTTGKVIQRLFIIDLYTQRYMSIDEANGKSGTFTIK